MYSESTISGKLISGTFGFALDLESSVNSISIRQSNNNFYGSVNSFYVANTLGYVATEGELLSESWISVGGSEISNGAVTSSGQLPNFQYQEIESEAGYCYRLSGNSYYEIIETDVVKETTQRIQGQCFIRIGKSPGSSEYINRNLTESEELVDLLFTIESNTFFVSYGYGSRNNIAHLIEPSLKRASPVHTWNKDNGTIYVKWNNIPNDTVLLNMSSKSEINISIVIDSSNSVFVNSTNVGPQSTTNRICFTYDNVTLNGGGIIQNSLNVSNINKIEFNNQPLKFSYSPSSISNTELMVKVNNG